MDSCRGSEQGSETDDNRWCSKDSSEQKVSLPHEIGFGQSGGVFGTRKALPTALGGRYLVAAGIQRGYLT
jgi:hypothetical protein